MALGSIQKFLLIGKVRTRASSVRGLMNVSESRIKIEPRGARAPRPLLERFSSFSISR